VGAPHIPSHGPEPVCLTVSHGRLASLSDAKSAVSRNFDFSRRSKKPNAGSWVGQLRAGARPTRFPPLGEAAASALVDLGSPLSYFPAPVATTGFARAAASRGFEVVGEIYPDLGCEDDATLVLQRSKHHTDPGAVVAMVSHFLQTENVTSLDGAEIALEAESICVHGDGPNAADVAAAIRTAVEGAGRAIETRAV
jgi:hypothetical protein